MKTEEKIAEAFDELYPSWAENEDLVDTPRRIAKYWEEMFEREDISKYLVTFTTDYDGMIVVKHIRVLTMCPHHFVPIEYDVSIGYIPNGRALGLSKFARIAQALAKPPTKQEDYTKELAEMLAELLKPQWLIVYVDGKHGCAVYRGVHQSRMRMVTSYIVGSKDISLKEEFFRLAFGDER